MEYLTIEKIAEMWHLSTRSVRNYCVAHRIEGAVLDGRNWLIPANAVKPDRKPRRHKVPNSLAKRLAFEMENMVVGGIYHMLQIEFTYNSNHIEGCKLSHDQTKYIFETNTIGFTDGTILVDDILETTNHFRCIDYVIKNYNKQLTEAFIKELHNMLKAGTSDSRKGWFAVGAYKRLPNVVGGKETVLPERVASEMKKLLAEYQKQKTKDLQALLKFHFLFERIHPFQDGNGRVGRLILFKECLKYGICPFVIEDEIKLFYYRGLNEWKKEPGYLLGTCETAQDKFKNWLNYFGIEEK